VCLRCDNRGIRLHHIWEIQQLNSCFQQTVFGYMNFLLLTSKGAAFQSQSQDHCEMWMSFNNGFLHHALLEYTFTSNYGYALPLNHFESNNYQIHLAT